MMNKSNVLSYRENQILDLIVLGKTNKEISNELKITINTVKYHIKNIMLKSGITDRRDFIELNAKGQIMILPGMGRLQ